MSKKYNEKKARQLEKAIDKELNSGYGAVDTDELQAADTRAAAMGAGDEELYEKKLTKEEKKAKAKAAREAKKKAKGAKPSSKKNKKAEEETETPTEAMNALDLDAHKDRKREEALDQLAKDNIVVTYESKKGALHANTRDINVSGVTVSFHGKPLVDNTDLVINYGNRYGFIGKFPWQISLFY